MDISTNIKSAVFNFALILFVALFCSCGKDNIQPVSTEDLFIQSAFTPNGDGRNDYFLIIPRSGIYIYDLFTEIYDKDYNLIFEGDKIYKYWDGYIKKEKCRPGIYYYNVEYRDSNGEKHVVHGTVELLLN